MHHEIKTAKEYFQAVWDGRKPFEIRLNDRGYNCGDTVKMKEVDGFYATGRWIEADITYVIGYAQKDNWVVFAFRETLRHDKRITQP